MKVILTLKSLLLSLYLCIPLSLIFSLSPYFSHPISLCISNSFSLTQSFSLSLSLSPSLSLRLKRDQGGASWGCPRVLVIRMSDKLSTHSFSGNDY
jgi:hypothetical protein